MLSSHALPAGTAAGHCIERTADRGVLNLLVLQDKGGRQTTVKAKVVARKELPAWPEQIARRGDATEQFLKVLSLAAGL